VNGAESDHRLPWLPNLLTGLRIFIVPVVVIFLLPDKPGQLRSFLAALCFLIASLTDYFDGYLARKYDSVSSLGKILDPMADKLLIAATLVMLVHLDRAPGWMVAVILCREISVNSLRGMATTRGVVIQAEALGKYKMIFQIIATVALLIHYPFMIFDFHVGGIYFLWIAMILGVWSGIDYFLKFFKVML